MFNKLKRRITKKRLDRDRDDSRIKRITKVGKTALAVGAGAVFFRRSGLSNHLNATTDALVPLLKEVNKDLVGKNRRDLGTVKKSFEKSFGKNNIKLKKRIEENKVKNIKGSKIKIDANKKNIAQMIKTIKQRSGYNLRTDVAKAKIDKEIINEIHKELKKVPEFSNLDDGYLNQLIQDIYSKIDDVDNGAADKTHEAIIKRMNPKTFEGLKINDSSKVDLVRKVEKFKSSKSKRVGKEIQKLHGETGLGKKIKDKALDFESLNNASETIFQKIDKKFEFFGIHIDSEYALTGYKTLKLKDLKEVGLDNIEYENSFMYSLNEKMGPRGNYYYEKVTEEFNTKKELSEFIKMVEESKDKRYDNIVIDKNIKYKIDENGNKIFYDKTEHNNLISSAKNWVKNTLPGNILFKFFDDYDQEIIDIIPSSKRTGTAYIQNKIRGLDESNLKTVDMMVHIGGKTYDIQDMGDSYELVESSFKQKMVRGYKATIVQRLLGKDNRYIPESYNNKITELLDLNQEGTYNIFKGLYRKFKKYDDESWSYNIINRASNLLIDERENIRNIGADNYVSLLSVYTGLEEKEVEQRLFSDIKFTFGQINKNIAGVSDDTISAISKSSIVNNLPIDYANLYEKLYDGDINSFFEHIDANRTHVRNNGLLKFLDDYKSDSQRVLKYKRIKRIEKNKFLSSFFGDYIPEDAIELDLTGQLKIELAKDMFRSMDNFSSTIAIDGFIDNLSNINNLEKDVLKSIRIAALADEYMGFDQNSSNEFSNAVGNIFSDNRLGRFLEKLDITDTLDDDFKNEMKILNSTYNIMTESYERNMNEKDYTDYAMNMFIKKTALGEVLIKDENGRIIINGDAVKEVGKELIAGRNDPENISELTIGLQYSIDKLNFGLDSVGLSLSSASTENIIDTVKNIGLKRILPVMGMATTLSVLNYESEKITGVSLKGATANAIMNVDLAGRRFLDATHLSNVINWFAETNVMHEYWTGQRHFNDHDEELDWYMNGYSPIRKGRFWFFGSSSEFRGNDITYFQPNFVRRAHSNYHDVSVYGSIDEKWAHSWIPTPQHPLAPLRNLWNPYWLEEKHLKEGDRPYPVTGKLFSEGTAWGTILNPTIGEIIKPVRMLPETRRRLGNDGRDAEAIIERLNTRIKQRGNQNDDLLMVRGSDIRNAEYVPYYNPDHDEFNVQFSNGNVMAPGEGYMENISDVSEYEAPDGTGYYEVNEYGKTEGNKENDVNDAITITYNQVNRVPDSMIDQEEVRAAKILKAINDRIIAGGKTPVQNRNEQFIDNSPKRNEGIFITRNLVNERTNFDEDIYAEKDVKHMVDKNLIKDYVRDIKYSSKQLSGIYGYIGEKALGENAYTYRYEQAGQMSSFTRSFWDASIGGLGGDTMEIVRRFFPSEDRKRININPLKNNMPDWITNTGSYGEGDPYTQIPKGEMRLPGKGYETLNELHPDMFGDYGAFDRYKILADIAPNSSEFKKWKKIAERTVTDESLKKQMEDIEARTSKMSGKHEFYEYKYFNNNTQYEDAIVKQVLNNGKVELVSGRKITLAGIKTNEYTTDTLKELIKPGDEVTLRTYKNVSFDEENNEAISEGVIYKKAENINSTLVNLEAATVNKSDNSALAIMGRQSGTQETIGAIFEAIGHAPIPLIHNKVMKVESAFESYKNEHIYGSSFQTWDHPIKNFIIPSFNKQSDFGILREGIGLGYAAFHFSKVSNKLSKDQKALHFASSMILSTLNPTAFVGGNVSLFLSKMTNVGISNSGNTLKTSWQAGAEVGTVLGAVKYGWDNADNPIKSAGAFALAGASMAKNLSGLGGAFENLVPKKAAIIGAIVGLGISAIKNPDFDKEKFFNYNHISDDVRKKWEYDEYFDRLNYVKYMGLYKVASARAAIFERTPIRDILKSLDKNKKKIAKLEIKEKKLASKQRGNLAANQYKLEEIRQRKMALQENTNMFFKGGKYTKAAIAYKKKAESTIYGLNNASTQDEILAAVPDQYKDHFNAFMKITDKKERKKILKYVPNYLEKPLKIAWGEKPGRIQSNRKYFRHHKMPWAGWRGWKPSVNMKHVKIKTIENEGMVMSDFGYYESEKSKPSFDRAPAIKKGKMNKSGIMHGINLSAALGGLGVHTQNVSVEETSNPGLWIISDVTGTASDIKKAAGYEATKAMQGVLSTIF